MATRQSTPIYPGSTDSRVTAEIEATQEPNGFPVDSSGEMTEPI